MIKLSNPKSIFIELNRDSSMQCIVATWKGLLSFDDVKMGALAVLDELKVTGYQMLMNDNREVLGDWRMANEWIMNEWLPVALTHDLRKFAHILSPYYYGKLSIEDLKSKIGNQLEIGIFMTEEDARHWLQPKVANKK